METGRDDQAEVVLQGWIQRVPESPRKAGFGERGVLLSSVSGVGQVRGR